VVYVSDRIIALCETGRHQLEGCGEYQMGRVRVVCFHVQSSEVVAPTRVD
jgi:hypothetical protein